MVTVAARRERVRFGRARGLSERHALRMAGMSGSVLRYERRDDGNQGLRERIVDLAHRHRRYGYRMIHLRLRHEGWGQCKAGAPAVPTREPDGPPSEAQESATRRAATVTSP